MTADERATFYNYNADERALIPGLTAETQRYDAAACSFSCSCNTTVVVTNLAPARVKRWANRDPIKEKGGLNLYGFVQNGPVDKTDILGRVPSYKIFDEGVLDTEFEDDANVGNDRNMVITFILFPSYQPCCEKIDFKQTYVFTNREGTETKAYGDDPNSFGWDVNDFKSVGVTYLDVQPGSTKEYYLDDGGVGDYLTYSSWMSDVPYDGDPHSPDVGHWYETSTGQWVRRKTRMTFKTCATCIEGIHKDKVYGCVRWKLDYADLTANDPPKLSVTAFCED